MSGSLVVEKSLGFKGRGKGWEVDSCEVRARVRCEERSGGLFSVW